MPPSFTVNDAVKLWETISNDPNCSSLTWSPEFLYCGPFHYELQAFPVKSVAKGHYIWIPAEWKSPLRFLNHTIYCLWQSSLAGQLPELLRRHSAHVGKYAEHIRSGFFEEVLEYWYPPLTQPPTNEHPTRRKQPLRSCYLMIFLLDMYNTGTLVPQLNTSRVKLGGQWQSDPALFDWEKWAKRNAAHQSLYETLPDVGTEEYRRLLEENKIARIPNAPSVELDSSSWSRYVSEALVMYSKRLHHQPSTVPSRRSHPSETEVDERASPEPPKAKRKCG
ncbi:hypothetical protein JVT61DRAFT_3133 [Boletus reticuloceps]|uniref:Uncharacterized protein n=1 Tax=Boletus reticuloceps TaxID=495285 RepID=A0A8I2YR66_9AGAM|nr:hypothetical protein JVT61DRAFT_3133 [Boletus reticuloceps]